MNNNDKPLRILEVIDNYFPIVDGVVNVVDNYAKHLSQIADCEVLAPKYPNAPIVDSYKLFKCNSISGGKYGVRLPVPTFDRKLRKHLKENKYDIIHLHSPVTLGKYILRYAKKHNIPTVITIHTMYHDEINRSVKIPFLQWFALNFLLTTIKKCDFIWAVAEGNKKCLKDIYKIDKPCEVVRNGTDYLLPTIDEQSSLQQNIRLQYALKDDEIVLLTVGRIVLVKNIQLVINTVKLLKDRGLHIKYFIVGDGDYKNQLKKLVTKLQLENEVIFVPFLSDKKQLSAYYLAADLFVFPSTFDSCPLVIQEASAMKCPSIVTRDAPSSEVVVDGHNGFLAEDTAEAYADKVEELIKDKIKLKAVGENAQKEIYTPWKEAIKNVYQKYQEIVNSWK